MSVSGPDVDALFEDDPGPLDGDLDDDEDDLKLDGAETKVWLVKVSFGCPHMPKPQQSFYIFH